MDRTPGGVALIGVPRVCLHRVAVAQPRYLPARAIQFILVVVEDTCHMLCALGNLSHMQLVICHEKLIRCSRQSVHVICMYPYIKLVPVLGPSVPLHPTEGNGPSGFFPLSWPLRPGAAGAFGVLPFVPGWVGLGPYIKLVPDPGALGTFCSSMAVPASFSHAETQPRNPRFSEWVLKFKTDRKQVIKGPWKCPQLASCAFCRQKA